MAKVPDKILDTFYAKLAESDALGQAAIAQLRALLVAGKKPKADDIVAIFEGAAREASFDSD